MSRICIIGSGNWGSAIAKILGHNVRTMPSFNPTITMWVFEEVINGEKLTHIINARHENVKYLPGIKLPENIVAIPDLKESAKDANVLIFVIPHQFLRKVCKDLKGVVRKDCKAISLMKGLDSSEAGLKLMSEVIVEELGIDVSVLSGANIANEVAAEKFCETTIGSREKETGQMFKKLFNTPYFQVTVVEDVAGVELCGALKNIVALAAGLIDGLKVGDNAKAAIIRIGLVEIKRFCLMFYAGVKSETFFESCGIADLITTCNGGRHRQVAEAKVLTGKSTDVLEKELLNGQKLQGTWTSKEVMEFLESKKAAKEFPLFKAVYAIFFEDKKPTDLIEELVKFGGRAHL